jgi:hypothetical protein
MQNFLPFQFRRLDFQIGIEVELIQTDGSLKLTSLLVENFLEKVPFASEDAHGTTGGCSSSVMRSEARMRQMPKRDSMLINFPRDLLGKFLNGLDGSVGIYARRPDLDLNSRQLLEIKAAGAKTI